MRDYLFRGKSLFDGSWVEGYLFSYGEPNAKETYILGELDRRESIYDVWKCAIEVDPLTVGQWTGVCDKNGRNIFEGDIVRAMMDYGPAGFYETIATISYYELDGYQWNYFDMNTIRIIGNIHDNPELLDNMGLVDVSKEV